MSVINENLLHYAEQALNNPRQATAEWLKKLRQDQFDLFKKKGLPTTKDEAWRYTNLSQLNQQRFNLPISHNQHVKFDSIKLDGDHYRLVFIDGHYQAELSQTPRDEILVIANFSSAMRHYEKLLQTHLPQKVNLPLAHLNTASFSEGAFIYIPSGCQLDRPIHLLYLNSATTSDNLQSIRNVVIVEKNAKAVLFEEHHSMNDTNYMTNVVTQLYANENSELEYIKLQQQNTSSLHFGNVEVSQQQDSRVVVHHYSLGGQLAREDIHSFLNAPGADIELAGLYLPLKKQHIDVHTYIHHMANNTTSEELFKGVIASKSRGVFNGMIRVEKDIAKAVANLQNKNLLLAKDAEINTKPELEIYSDDVKCKHGATVGQIDQNMLFYLRSRGIHREAAYQMLLLAFVRQGLNVIACQAIADRILACVMTHCEQV